MRPAPSRLRVAALVGAAALAVHELRYMLAYGERSGEALAQQGHSYLPLAGLLVTALLALAGAQLLRVFLGARRTGSDEGAPPPFALSWALAAATLACVYVSQETLEGLLASGHPQGIAAVLGHGGLVAFPLAAGFGLLVALVLRWTRTAIAAAARRRRRRSVPPAPAPAARPVARVLAPRASVLARHLAGRAPPLFS